MSYKTVAGRGEAQLIEKKSRFIGYCNRVETEEEALAFLNEIRQLHPQATHHVYAYVIRENNLSRFSDDGEPAKTAGAPVLDVILKEGLTDVIVVVTRYFGGTLLGTGGLVKSYSASAKEGILASGVVSMVPCVKWMITVPYTLWGKTQHLIEEIKAVMLRQEFTDEVSVEALCREEAYFSFQKELLNLSNGTVTVHETGREFYALKAE